MRRVAGDQLQAVRDGQGSDHRIATADWSPDTVEIAGDLPSKIGGGLVEKEDVL